MISTVSLDPASLVLNFEGSIFREQDGDWVNDMFTAACSDTPLLCSTLLDGPYDSPKVGLQASFASSIWHEKRHFLDLILTNYGAFRMRHFFQVYCNLGGLIHEARESDKEIFCPVDAYLDPVRCEVHGLNPRPRVSALGGILRKAKQFLVEDERTLTLSSGTECMVSGEAQLEALAWYCQQSAAQLHLGLEGARSAFRDMQKLGFSESRYEWATYLGLGAKLAQRKVIDKRDTLNVTALMPLLVASLMIRASGKVQLPANRLGRLSMELSKEPRAFKGVEEVWDHLNKIAKQQWDRTADEELNADYDHESGLLDKIEVDEGVPDVAKATFRDFHELRGKLIAAFKENPLLVLEPAHFAAKLMPRLRPLVVLNKSGGVLGLPPKGFWRIYGYMDPEAKEEDGRWWWSSMSPDWPPNKSGSFAFAHPEKWRDLLTEAAPAAKLLINGRRHKTAMGAELHFIQRWAEAQWGIQIRQDPLFEFPREDCEEVARTLRHVRLDDLVCDSCSKKVAEDKFSVLPPWFFRHSPQMLQLTHKAYGGNEAGRLRMIRDWAYWVVCPKCMDMLTKLPFAREALEATTDVT